MMAIKTQEKKKHGNRYNDEEKEEILKYYKENSFNETLTKFEIGHTTLTNWINKSTPTPTPKKSVLEEILERRTGLSGSKKITPTPTTPTPTPTVLVTPTTPIKIKEEEVKRESIKITPTPTSTPTKSIFTPTTPTEITPTPTKITPTPTKNEIKSLTFEQIVEKLIEYGKNSSFNDYNNVYQSLIAGNKKEDRNPRFQSKRIKDALRMLEAMGIKFVQEGN